MIYAKLFKSVPHCSKLCQSDINLCKMSETYLLGYSLAQFYTVKHTCAQLNTKIIFTRGDKNFHTLYTLLPLLLYFEGEICTI